MVPQATATYQAALATPAKQPSKVAFDEAITFAMDRLDASQIEFIADGRCALVFATKALPAAYCDAVGLRQGEPLTLELSFTDGRHIPSARLRHDGAWCAVNATSGQDMLAGHECFLLQMKGIAHTQLEMAAEAATGCRYLVDVYHHIGQRLVSLSDHCIVCDAPQEVAGLKPVPCAAPRCVYQFDELGLGAALDELYQQPAVADLLISMTATAATCPVEKRRRHIFASAPTDFLMEGSKDVHYAAMTAALAGLPALSELPKPEDLQAHLRATHPALGKLVRWILSTSRGYMRALQADDQFAAMRTPHQFVLRTGTPQRESAFQALKQKNGSFFAFHGSPNYNWHAIIRDGLKVFSGTALMSTGAALGRGIYLSSSLATAQQYVGTSSVGWQHSGLGTAPVCIALCEVICNAKAEQNIQVIPDETHVMTRYLFVYENNTLPAQVTSASLKQQLQASAQFDLLATRAKLAALRAAASPPKAAHRLAPPLAADTELTGRALGSLSSHGDSSASELGDGSDSEYSVDDDADDALALAPTLPTPTNTLAATPAVSHARSATLSVTAQRRLMTDLRRLGVGEHSATRALGFAVHRLIEDDLGHWEVRMWLDDCSLATDLQKAGVDYLTFRVRFSANYPIEPPFMWLKSPVLQYRTGFISRGAVCSTLFVTTGTSAGWSPVLDMQQVFLSIRTNMQSPEAAGRLADVRRPGEYSEEQALAGWSHAKRLHGW